MSVNTRRIRTLLLPEILKIKAGDATCGGCEERIRGFPPILIALWAMWFLLNAKISL